MRLITSRGPAELNHYWVKCLLNGVISKVLEAILPKALEPIKISRHLLILQKPKTHSEREDRHASDFFSKPQGGGDKGRKRAERHSLFAGHVRLEALDKVFRDHGFIGAFVFGHNFVVLLECAFFIAFLIEALSKFQSCSGRPLRKCGVV